MGAKNLQGDDDLMWKKSVVAKAKYKVEVGEVRICLYPSETLIFMLQILTFNQKSHFSQDENPHISTHSCTCNDQLIDFSRVFTSE